MVQGEDRETTIIDGNQSGRVVTFYSGEDSTAVLSGFTIQNGLADYGGGIHCYESNPKLANLMITGNHSGGGGGIMCSDYSSPTISNVVISNNKLLKFGFVVETDITSEIDRLLLNCKKWFAQ